MDRVLLRAGVSKPVGIETAAKLLTAESLARQPNYAWFLLSPLEQKAEEANPFTELRALYASPRVITLPAEAK
jgi:hypothetical protein